MCFNKPQFYSHMNKPDQARCFFIVFFSQQLHLISVLSVCVKQFYHSCKYNRANLGFSLQTRPDLVVIDSRQRNNMSSSHSYAPDVLPLKIVVKTSIT